jgi:hypothetical protein
MTDKETKTIRDIFVKDFGEEEAQAFEQAAIEHSNGLNSNNKGSDPFKWVLTIVIGYDCFQKEYRKYHNITTPTKKIKKWIKDNADLGTHDGDFDATVAVEDFLEWIEEKMEEAYTQGYLDAESDDLKLQREMALTLKKAFGKKKRTPA